MLHGVLSSELEFKLETFLGLKRVGASVILGSVFLASLAVWDVGMVVKDTERDSKKLFAFAILMIMNWHCRTGNLPAFIAFHAALFASIPS
jgi:hypothetical protein